MRDGDEPAFGLEVRDLELRLFGLAERIMLLAGATSMTVATVSAIDERLRSIDRLVEDAEARDDES